MYMYVMLPWQLFDLVRYIHVLHVHMYVNHSLGLYPHKPPLHLYSIFGIFTSRLTMKIHVVYNALLFFISENHRV